MIQWIRICVTNEEKLWKCLRRKTTVEDHSSFNGCRDIKVRNWGNKSKLGLKNLKEKSQINSS